MQAQNWEQIQTVFGEVADLPLDRMTERVRQLCGDDRDLLKSVLELLEEDAKHHPLFDSNAVDVASRFASAALDDSQVRDLVQRQIGPYVLLRVLGEGGMGVVYLAERTDIGGLVAIKLLRDAWLSPMRRERFAVEQRTMAKLNHPAIARIYDASTTEDGTPWFVMEYADGLPLTEYVRARGGSVRDDLLLFRRVCEAVQYAHGHAIIHRDLKPSNILVTSEGEVKLLDFGIAKQMELETEGKSTVTGLRLMTPGYAAPEQISGAEIGTFTDVYSLGVLLYEMLTGRIPKTTEDLGELPQKPSLAAHIAGSRPAVAELSKREWADLDVLCLKALQPEPERRYRSADALIRDVTAYLEGRVLEARPDSPSYAMGKFVRRNRSTLAAVTAGVLLLIGATALFTIRLARARDVALAEASRTQRIQRFLQDMLGNEDAEAGPSSSLKVTTLLDRAAQQATTLSEDPETQLKLYQTLGAMYGRLGEFSQSTELLSRALVIARKLHGPKGDTVAAVLVQLGVVRGDSGDVKEARQDIQQALDIEAGTRSPVGTAIALQARVAMGTADALSGNYKEAMNILGPLSQMQPETGGATAFDVRDSVSALAVAQLYTRKYELAEKSSRRAIDLDRQLLGESHPQTGSDVINLASAKASLGEFSNAEPLYRSGIAILAAWYGEAHPDVVAAKSFLARNLISENKYGEAQTILQQVLQTQEKTYGHVHERVAFTLDALGEISVHRGGLQEAESDFSRALSIEHTLFGDKNPQTVRDMSNLGNVYLKESKNAKAEATLRASLTALESLPGSNYIGLTRGRWGRALFALKRYPEAERQLTSAEDLMMQMPHPPSELKDVREDLVKLYLTKRQPDKAKLYQVKLGNGAPSHG